MESKSLKLHVRHIQKQNRNLAHYLCHLMTKTHVKTRLVVLFVTGAWIVPKQTHADGQRFANTKQSLAYVAQKGLKNHAIKKLSEKTGMSERNMVASYGVLCPT